MRVTTSDGWRRPRNGDVDSSRGVPPIGCSGAWSLLQSPLTRVANAVASEVSMRHHIAGPLDCHQRRLVFRALVAGSLLSAAAWVPVGQWANAAGNIASAAPKTYTVQPASQKDSPVLQNLGATFTISVV